QAARSNYPKLFLLLAGASFAAMVHSNLCWASYLPAYVWLYPAAAKQFRSKPLRTSMLEAAIFCTCGGVALTGAFCLFNTFMGGRYLFFVPSITFGATSVQAVNPNRHAWAEIFRNSKAYGTTPLWLLCPVVAFLCAAFLGVRQFT